MSSIFTDITNINQLSSHGIRVSDLYFVDNFISDLYFIAGESSESYSWYDILNSSNEFKTTSPEWESSKIQYSDISSKILDDIRTSARTLEGYWAFGNKKTNILLQDTKSIDTTDPKNPTLSALSNLSDSKSTLNVKYFEDKILQEIYNLSSYIYDDPHLPSNVGDVIFSTSLSDVKSVSNIYEGTWEQITGSKFIIGHGTIKENTMTKFGDIPEAMYSITANTETTLSAITFSSGLLIRNKNQVKLLNNFKLDDNYLIKHNHKFSAIAEDFKIKWIRGWGGIDHADRDAAGDVAGTVDIFAYEFPTGCNRYDKSKSRTSSDKFDMIVGTDAVTDEVAKGEDEDSEEIIKDNTNMLTGVPASINHKGSLEIDMNRYMDPKHGGAGTDLKTTKDVYTIDGEKVVHAGSTPPTHYNYPPFMTVYMYHRVS